MAVPFEALVLLALALVVAAVIVGVTVRGGLALVDGLLVAVLGRSATGTVTRHLRTVHDHDADGDPTVSYDVEVEFVDRDGRTQIVGYSSSTQPAIGTPMRIRWQLGRPTNRWVRRTGPGPVVAGVLGYAFGLVVWAFCASPFILGLSWLLRRMT
jgi:hypothetical protein